MKEVKTCEEYILAELEEKKDQLKKYTAACESYRKFFKETEEYINAMKKFLSIRKASGGGEVISMNCVFEAYEPHEFRMIKEMFELRVEENA